MDPEKENLIKTLQQLQHSIGKGDLKRIENLIDCFRQNLARNKQLLSELYTSNTRCTTQTDLILAACQSKKDEILCYILKQTDILVHLNDDSFDDTEVNKQRTEAFKHALSLEDFSKVEMLYDFWCGNLYWSGHDMKNIEMVGNVLQSANDACPDYKKKLAVYANVHCLLTFNAFQREIYTELAELKPYEITPKETATMLLKVFRIYDKYSLKEKIRLKHSSEDQELKVQVNFNDDSSTYYKNLVFIHYEVYFRKLDFNIALLTLENLYVIRNHLKSRFDEGVDEDKIMAKTYEEIESEIYHFIYRTREDWRLYLPKKRQIILEEYTGIHEGREKKIKLALDLHKVYNGPVLFLERKSFKESFVKFQTILDKYIIKDLNKKNGTLLNDNYLRRVSYMRDHYSLLRIARYIKVIEKAKHINVLMVERVLQVVGEMSKNTDKSDQLSPSIRALLQTTISVETIRHLKNLRNFLSKTHEGNLSTRITMEKKQSQKFEAVKEELVRIKDIINPIIDISKAVLDKSLLEKGLRLLEQRIQSLPAIAKCLVDAIYQLYNKHKNELVKESGDFYQGFWRHTDLTLQLLEEIPWIMQNKDRILKDIQKAKTDLNDKIARILPTLTPILRKMLELIIKNNNYVKTINQCDNRIQMSDCPDDEEINGKKKYITKLMKKNKYIDMEIFNKIKGYKDHWETVKMVVKFCRKESELFATIQDRLTDSLTFIEVNLILSHNLAEIEAIGVMHRSTLTWLTRRTADVLGLKIYRKCEDFVRWLFGLNNQNQFGHIEALHEETTKNIKPSDPRSAQDLLISCLISRLDLLKQILQHDHDVEFRVTIEMVLADIANVLHKGKPSLMSKSAKLLRTINLGNVLDHGHPFLEVIGDVFNSHDLTAELLDKAVMFDQDAKSIEALYELFKDGIDYQTISTGDLPKMNAQQILLYEQFKKTANWKSYVFLARCEISKSQRSKK